MQLVVNSSLEPLVVLLCGGLLREAAQHRLHIGDECVAVELAHSLVVLLQPGEQQGAAPRLVTAHSSVHRPLVLIPENLK